MITPDHARRLIARRCKSLQPENVPLDAALGRTLSEDVLTPFPLPRFDNSAMDGFAVRSRDVSLADERRPVRLSIVQTVYAGTRPAVLRRGEACRIMTGAPMPRGGDSVIPVEEAIVEGNALVLSKQPPKHRHVRRRGEEVPSGKRILKAGTVVHPGVIACLASVGKNNLTVVRRPRVAVIATGDETVAPGKTLDEGQIYDSNSHMLVAMVRQMGIEPVRVRRVGDHRGSLLSAVQTALERCDVLITAGGISMGEHDLLRPVFDALGVEEVFWRVRQKPGKPLYFGVRGNTHVFGLPGNPASAFVCFYAYVYEALERLSGLGDRAGLVQETRTLASAPRTDRKRWLLLRGSAGNRSLGVTQLPLQGSHMITSLAITDRLIVVPADSAESDTTFSTLRLPHAKEGTK